MERSKGGRPQRWDPDIPPKTVKARLPVPLADALKAEAKKRGMSVQDFIGEFAASVTGLPYDPQEALRLSA